MSDKDNGAPGTLGNIGKAAKDRAHLVCLVHVGFIAHIRLYGVKDTGISKGAFSSYLSGQYNPKADKTELIADSLDVDLRWLYGENVPMENTQKDYTALQYVFYNNSCSEYLLDDLDDMYIAMKTQYSALIPRFYVLVNRSGNEIHILPLFLREDSSEFYDCPSDFFHADRHSIFTRDFDSINVKLSTATIYYYGIWNKLDIENPIIRINTAFKGCSSLEKISVLPRIYHN